MTKPRLSDFDFSGSLGRYELDLQRGVAKSEGEEDHRRMMEALAALQNSGTPTPLAVLSRSETSPAKGGLTLQELLNKYLLLRKLRPASVLAVKNTVKEFTGFLGQKCYISEIMVSDITRYQEHLATKGNVPRTIDGKIAYLKSVLNFGIKQDYLRGKNPCENMSLMTKKQKLTGGYEIFEFAEIEKIYSGNYLKTQKTEDPDYFWVLVLALLTGCRVSELTSLTASQVQETEQDEYFIIIRDAKTNAGKRQIPIPKAVLDGGFAAFIEGKDFLFKYAPRPGKGSGNAVGKKFSRHLLIEKVIRDKLVFHSLRKFCNDYFMKNGVEFEPRCQIFGHEIEAVNVATYSRKYNADELAAIVEPIQMKLWALLSKN